MSHPPRASLPTGPAPTSVTPTPTPSGDDVNEFRQVGRSSVLYLVGAFVSKLAKFLLVPFYVRVLTKSEVGMVLFLDALSFALVRVFSLGLPEAVKRFHADFRTPLASDRYAWGIWWVVIGISAVFCGLAWVSGPVWHDWVDPSIPTEYYVLAVAIAAVMGNSQVPISRYIALQQPVRHTVYTTGQFVLLSAGIVVLVVGFDLGVRGVLWGQFGASLIWTVYTGALTGHWARWRPHFVKLRESFAFSILFVPNLLFVWGITFADRVLLVRFVSLEELAIYGLGYQIGTLITIFSLSVTNAWVARFYRAADGVSGAREYSRTLTRMTLVLLWLSLATFVLAPELVAVAGTTAYAASTPILQMVAGAHVFHGLNRAFYLPLLLKKKTSMMSLSSGIGFAVNVALNLLLIPRYGIYGAGIATILSYVVLAVSSYLMARGVYPVKVQARPLATAGVVAVLFCAAALALPAISVVHTGARLVLVAAFPAVLWGWQGLRVLTAEDRQVARQTVAGATRRLVRLTRSS